MTSKSWALRYKRLRNLYENTGHDMHGIYKVFLSYIWYLHHKNVLILGLQNLISKIDDAMFYPFLHGNRL